MSSLFVRDIIFLSVYHYNVHNSSITNDLSTNEGNIKSILSNILFYSSFIGNILLIECESVVNKCLNISRLMYTAYGMTGTSSKYTKYSIKQCENT